MSERWQDSLMRLHLAGWNTDDIDEACEALHEACTEGHYEGADVESLTTDQVNHVLTVALDARLAAAVVAIAALRRQQSSEATAVRAALYDLDAFAFAYAGDL